MDRKEPPVEPSRALDDYAHSVIGAAIEVHRHLGPGFLESIYENALNVEMKLRGIVFRSQVTIPIFYKDREIAQQRIDLLIGDELVVELKAIESFTPLHVAQILSYMRAGCFQLGLLINFNVTSLRLGIRRVIHSG